MTEHFQSVLCKNCSSWTAEARTQALTQALFAVEK